MCTVYCNVEIHAGIQNNQLLIVTNAVIKSDRPSIGARTVCWNIDNYRKKLSKLYLGKRDKAF